jgi:hypothetical protein
MSALVRHTGSGASGRVVVVSGAQAFFDGAQIWIAIDDL